MSVMPPVPEPGVGAHPPPSGPLPFPPLPEQPWSSPQPLGNQAARRALERAERERAEKERAEKERAEIKGLPAEQRSSLNQGMALGRDLVDDWHTGAVQAVGIFKSSMVSDQSTVRLALAGNLMWAATSIELVPAKVLLSFLGAMLGTLGAVPSSYEAVMGPVKGDLTTKLNNLRDQFKRNLDIILLPVIRRTGFANFLMMGLPDQNALVWSSLFRDIGPTTTPTEGSKAYVLRNLQRADEAAAARLALYRRAWLSSTTGGGVDFSGPFRYFDPSKWAAEAGGDPVWLYAGGDVSVFDKLRIVGDDPLLGTRSRDMRGALLLRRAIEELWPWPGQ